MYMAATYKHSKTWFLTSELKEKLERFLKPAEEQRILEIGCFEGLSSVFFADTFLERPTSRLTCVDPFLTIPANDHSEFLQGDEERNFDYNLSVCKHSEKITVHKITSDAFFEGNQGGTYTFIYIDGCHLPEYITRDMEHAFQCLEHGGIMWMDDYGGGDGIQIRRTMDAFLEKYAGQYDLLHKGYQLAIGKR